ncbi:endonuclease/exonuclease/phosphatase family protein [Nocardioides lentus]|uniref:Endonuclease/exonuclease/phosphatase family protein n=1 Tax=Nocardioides lentus TaxID=338077 RepID=A0ABN2NXS4_9ACTN
MTSRNRRTAALLAAGALAGSLALAGLTSAGATSATAGPRGPGHGHGHGPGHGHGAREAVRFATFNASLNRAAEGGLSADLASGDDEQIRNAAETVQRTRPDVLLVNEFDFVAGGGAADDFRENYLEVPQRGARPIRYPYAYVAPVNTGVPSGHDLNNDGTVGGPDDAFGFGTFPGQYGMLVLSRHPVDRSRVRTFREFLWADMPGALLPEDPATGEPWFTDAELADVRLSSKSHWDVPIRVGRRTVHFLVSHPTPPTFDGAEDRNGRRNHDEIRFWADYVASGKRARYVYDDRGRRGGLPRGAAYVIAGDQNADPYDGDSVPGAARQLLTAPRVIDPRPASRGAVEASRTQSGNADQEGPARLDTADFADPVPGNLRVDYVLPSRPLRVRDAGVFWPVAADPLSRLTGTFPFPTSDHRLVWVDVTVPGR